MRKINSILLVPIIFLLITESCRKSGSIVPPGTIGTANPTDTTVTTTYSAWYTPTSYTTDTASGTYQFYTNIPALNITQDTLKNDTVLVYSKLDGYNPVLWPSNLVSPMPVVITYMESSTTYKDTWSARITPGNIQITFVDNRNNSAGLYYAHKFRYRILSKSANTITSGNIKNYGWVKSPSRPPD